MKPSCRNASKKEEPCAGLKLLESPGGALTESMETATRMRPDGGLPFPAHMSPGMIEVYGDFVDGLTSRGAEALMTFHQIRTALLNEQDHSGRFYR